MNCINAGQDSEELQIVFIGNDLKVDTSLPRHSNCGDNITLVYQRFDFYNGPSFRSDIWLHKGCSTMLRKIAQLVLIGYMGVAGLDANAVEPKEKLTESKKLASGRRVS